MNILCIGDVVGSVGCQFLRAHLPALKKTKAIDLVIANGENSADGNGITPASAEHLLDSGVDVITTGNHSFRRRESYDLYDTWDNLLRPANFPSQAPGKGLCVVDKGRVQVAVINLMGTVYLESLRCPFETLDALLKTPDLPKLCVVDFHAEATGEKRAMGFYADGRVTALFGIPAAKYVFENPPVPVVFSGFEIGRDIRFPSEALYRNLSKENPIVAAYQLHSLSVTGGKSKNNNRESWDLTSVLYVVSPGSFGISERGNVEVTPKGSTLFKSDKSGMCQFLTADSNQGKEILQRLIEGVSGSK